MEVADTSARAMEMVKQQQSQQICWGGSSYMMSLGTYSPLEPARPAGLGPPASTFFLDMVLR